MNADPWEHVDISNAKFASAGSSKPFASIKTNIKDTIEALRLLKVTFGLSVSNAYLETFLDANYEDLRLIA